jgi:hypothetical protein
MAKHRLFRLRFNISGQQNALLTIIHFTTQERLFPLAG